MQEGESAVVLRVLGETQVPSVHTWARVSSLGLGHCCRLLVLCRGARRVVAARWQDQHVHPDEACTQLTH